jgi:hypothetical protein
LRGAAAAGLDGLLNEWVWTQRTPAVGMDSYGGPVWGLATEPAAALDAEAQEQRVAAACDDGTVRRSRMALNTPLGRRRMQSFMHDSCVMPATTGVTGGSLALATFRT